DQLIWKCKNKNKFSSNFCREIHEKVFPPNAVPLFSSRLQLKHSKDTLINKPLLGNLKDLVTKNKIVIKEADKNSGVTLMDKEDYDMEIYRQLNNTNFYRQVSDYQFELNIELIKHTIINSSFREQVKKI